MHSSSNITFTFAEKNGHLGTLPVHNERGLPRPFVSQDPSLDKNGHLDVYARIHRRALALGAAAAGCWPGVGHRKSHLQCLFSPTGRIPGTEDGCSDRLVEDSPRADQTGEHVARTMGHAREIWYFLFLPPRVLYLPSLQQVTLYGLVRTR